MTNSPDRPFDHALVQDLLLPGRFGVRVEEYVDVGVNEARKDRQTPSVHLSRRRSEDSAALLSVKKEQGD